MIDRSHPLPVTRQARELGISRGSVYYLPRPTSDADLAIMRLIDELHMDFPFAGTHHVSILTMNGDSYRLKESAGRRRAAATQAQAVQN